MSPTKKPQSGSSISADVLDQIKHGQVKMHADWYFALLSAGFAAALASTLLVAVYSVNLALLRMEIARDGLQPWLLGRYYLDAAHFPLGFLLVAAVSVAGVIYLLRRRSEYARALPEWSIVLGVIVFVMVLGAGFSRTALNQPLEQHGPFRQLYEHEQREHPRYQRQLPIQAPDQAE